MINFLKKYSSLLVALAVIGYIVSWPFLNAWPNPFTWDAFGYYLYMPMAYIHNDLGITDYSVIENVQQEQFISSTMYQIYKTDTGNWVTRYPVGLSILLTPFYLLGHLFAKLGGYSQNGFSLPYQIAIVSGCLFYLSASILILRKILLNWFSDKIVAITLLAICFGTNYIDQATVSSSMPHALLFFVYTLIILFTIKWHNDKTKLNALLLGSVLGLAVICRPTEVVAVFIPLFWAVKNLKELKLKFIDVWKNNRVSLFIILGTFFAFIFIQLLYWKLYVGSFIHDSYNNVGEGLDLLHPHTLNVLFSFKKGWLIYTPIMVFAIVGFYYLKKKKPQYFLSFFVYGLMNLYLVSSWTCWWYAQSFSQRALVQSYVVMAIAMAFFIQALFKFGIVKKLIFGGLLLAFFSLNVFQLYQAKKGFIHGDRMTFDYYKAIFGKTEVDVNQYQHLLSFNRDLTFEQAASQYNYEKEPMFMNSFEQIEDTNIVSTKYSRFGEKSLIISKNREFSKDYTIRYRELTNTEYVWLEVKFWAYFTDSNSNFRIVNAILRGGKNYGYQAVDVVNANNPIELNTWKEYKFYYLTPHIRSTSDRFQSYFWYAGGGDAYVDDLTITRYKPY